MAEAGWWSGDLHLERPLREIEAIMQADDLHVAPVVTWSNKKTAWSAGRFPEQNVVAFEGNR